MVTMVTTHRPKMNYDSILDLQTVSVQVLVYTRPSRLTAELDLTGPPFCLCLLIISTAGLRSETVQSELVLLVFYQLELLTKVSHQPLLSKKPSLLWSRKTSEVFYRPETNVDSTCR